MAAAGPIPSPAAALQTSGLELVTDETDAALAMLAAGGRGRSVDEASWRRLFATDGYRRLRARVYLLIKPRTNSFVFEASTDPAIRLYLDPAVTPARLENTITHELHHTGCAGA